MKQLLAFLIVLAASPAFSQGLEIALVGGYTTAGGIEQKAWASRTSSSRAASPGARARPTSSRRASASKPPGLARGAAPDRHGAGQRRAVRRRHRPGAGISSTSSAAPNRGCDRFSWPGGGAAFFSAKDLDGETKLSSGRAPASSGGRPRGSARGCRRATARRTSTTALPTLLRPLRLLPVVAAPVRADRGGGLPASDRPQEASGAGAQTCPAARWCHGEGDGNEGPRSGARPAARLHPRAPRTNWSAAGSAPGRSSASCRTSCPPTTRPRGRSASSSRTRARPMASASAWTRIQEEFERGFRPLGRPRARGGRCSARRASRPDEPHTTARARARARAGARGLRRHDRRRAGHHGGREPRRARGGRPQLGCNIALPHEQKPNPYVDASSSSATSSCARSCSSSTPAPSSCMPGGLRHAGRAVRGGDADPVREDRTVSPRARRQRFWRGLRRIRAITLKDGVVRRRRASASPASPIRRARLSTASSACCATRAGTPGAGAGEAERVARAERG